MIKIDGIGQHPRYREQNNPVAKFNKYLYSPFYRYVIMSSIEDPQSFRDPINIVETAIEEAKILEESPADEVEILTLKEILVAFLDQQIMEKYRGKLFEQIVRWIGPKDGLKEYQPERHSVEEAKIYCESIGYANGNTDKNVDVAFFNGNWETYNSCTATEFIACEVKCNINTFVESIVQSISTGSSVDENKSYQKLLYLKDMLLSFGRTCKVILCSLKEPRIYIKRFLNEQGFGLLNIWVPLV